MACPRCAAESPDEATTSWCRDCELQYDGWVRRHATDIVWQALVGTVVVSTCGLLLPLLGVGVLVGAAGAFAGFGTVYGLSRLTRRKRRRQFLATSLPRAYLPAPK
jgi:hypothetical protein